MHNNQPAMMRSQTYEQQYRIKIIMVGDSGVGKTSIRQRLCKDIFDPFSVKTVGVQFSTRRFVAPFEQRQQKFSVCLWDVVGELSNPELQSSFFKNAMGVVYVFDLTNEDSMKSLKVWKDKVAEHNSCNRTIQMLIGNKNDLRFLREVSRQSGESLRRELEIGAYYEVSALDEKGEIEPVFQSYFTDIAKAFNLGVKKPTKLKKPEAYHRSCV